MEVRNRFAGVGTVIDDQTIPGTGHAELLGNRSGLYQEVAQELFMVHGGQTNTPQGDFRDDQDVDGRLGMDVAEGQDLVVLIDNVRGDLAGDDFFEKGHGDGEWRNPGII